MSDNSKTKIPKLQNLKNKFDNFLKHMKKSLMILKTNTQNKKHKN